jgi:hypothetical protein
VYGRRIGAAKAETEGRREGRGMAKGRKGRELKLTHSHAARPGRPANSNKGAKGERKGENKAGERKGPEHKGSKKPTQAKKTKKIQKAPKPRRRH